MNKFLIMAGLLSALEKPVIHIETDSYYDVEKSVTRKIGTEKKNFDKAHARRRNRIQKRSRAINQRKNSGK